ncbi:hypothetical protein QTG56_00300 [Rossellomorea sp. AcN35-11]|nr:hypothetical protein [Rossellomorea aquimaris]WJV29657.1 hypothetical protein QTG56_00300 [Rossellomorea sp. AcN35-11]
MYWLLDLLESIVQHFYTRTDERDGKKYQSKEEEIEDGFIHLSRGIKVFGVVFAFIIICIGIYFWIGY